MSIDLSYRLMAEEYAEELRHEAELYRKAAQVSRLRTKRRQRARRAAANRAARSRLVPAPRMAR